MIKGKNGLPRYCCWAVDRHGKRRVRSRKGRFSTYLSGMPWSENFMHLYGCALENLKPEPQPEIGAERTIPGTFNALIVAYYRSPEFRCLKASTAGSRRAIIERFRAEHGDKPVRLLTRSHIKAILAKKADTPEAANSLLKVLRLLLGLAVDLGMIRFNPAAEIKRFKSRGDGIHSWSDDDVAQFEARHPIGSKARLALALLLYTAQRRGDVVRMGRQHLQAIALQKKLIVRQEKTGAPLLIPVHPELDRALAAVPADQLTFLVGDRGRPFTADRFGHWFREKCNEAGLPHCSAHGLRKAAATRLANAGCSTDQIKAITGHKTLAEVARYTRAADQARLAGQAMGMLSRTEPEQVCPTA